MTYDKTMVVVAGVVIVIGLSVAGVIGVAFWLWLGD